MNGEIDAILRKWRNDDWTDTEALDRARFVSSLPIIAIGGCARSGTTLLRVMLDTHSLISIGPPSNVFVPTPIAFDEIAFRYDIPVDALRELDAGAADRAEFIDRFAQRCLAQTGKIRWGEKTARNLLRFDWIHEHFPRGVTINVIRDGRDVVCSLRTHRKRRVVNGELQPTGNVLPLESCVDRWLLSMEIARHYRGVPGYYEVYYEDLVLRSEVTLHQITEFLAVPYEESMLQFHTVETPYRDPLRFPQNVEATRPLSAASIGRWRRDLSDSEQQYVTGRLYPTLKALGYGVGQL
jgi:protein-tyrosine sulfotransferase